MKKSQEPPLRSGNQEVIRTCFEAPITKISHSHLTRQRWQADLSQRHEQPWHKQKRKGSVTSTVTTKLHNKAAQQRCTLLQATNHKIKPPDFETTTYAHSSLGMRRIFAGNRRRPRRNPKYQKRAAPPPQGGSRRSFSWGSRSGSGT